MTDVCLGMDGQVDSDGEYLPRWYISPATVESDDDPDLLIWWVWDQCGEFLPEFGGTESDAQVFADKINAGDTP